MLDVGHAAGSAPYWAELILPCNTNEPISKAGDAFVGIHLRKGKILHGQRKRDSMKNNPVDTKVREGKKKQVPEQIFPCKLWKRLQYVRNLHCST